MFPWGILALLGSFFLGVMVAGIVCTLASNKLARDTSVLFAITPIGFGIGWLHSGSSLVWPIGCAILTYLGWLIICVVFEPLCDS